MACTATGILQLNVSGTNRDIYNIVSFDPKYRESIIREFQNRIDKTPDEKENYTKVIKEKIDIEFDL